MPRRTQKHRDVALDDLEFAGVELMPLPEYLAALDASVETTRRALESGAPTVDTAGLPPPRVRVVLKSRSGRHFSPVPTTEGIEYRPHAAGGSLELLGTGGAEGGFLDADHVSPAPLLGNGASPTDWIHGYLTGLPTYDAVNDQAARWRQSSVAYDRQVGAQRQESDEWRRAYFAGIREAASARFPITESSTAQPRGPRAHEACATWRRDEYHMAFFDQLRANSEQQTEAARAYQQRAPHDGFAGALEPSTPTAIYSAKPRLPGRMADMLLNAAQREFPGEMRAALEDFVKQKAAALTERGGPLHVLQDAFGVISQLNEVGALELLAGLADKAIFPTGPNGVPNPIDLNLLKSRFADKLARFGINKGLEELLGDEAAAMLKKSGVTDSLGDSAADLALDHSQNLGGLADKFMDQLPGAAVDQAIDRLLGGVNDGSSTAKQVAAHYKSQINSLLNRLLSSKGRADLQKQFDETFNGASSSACIPFGLANPVGGPDMVQINGLPSTRLADDCDMPTVPDKGKFFQGNRTIFVNGMPPAGEIHAALGAQGTIATPMIISPDVLMGAATVTVAIKVETEAPKAADSSDQGTAEAAASSSSTEEPEVCEADQSTIPPDSAPMCTVDESGETTRHEAPACYGPDSGLDEYDLTVAMLRESQAAAAQQGISPHDYIQNLRRSLDDPALRDHPALVNAHRFWKGFGLKHALGKGGARALGKLDEFTKLTGIDRVLQLLGVAGGKNRPSPYRPEAHRWYEAGARSKPGDSWPTRENVAPRKPTPQPESQSPYLGPEDIPDGHLDDPLQPESLDPRARSPGSTTWDRYGRPTQH